MPRRSRIRIGALEDLAAQLRFEPRSAALRQIERAERLAAEVDPRTNYAEDWVAWKITGYRPSIAEPALLVGEALLGDLSAFVERLSDETRLQLSELDPGALSLDDLCARWRVSRKSIERYRRLGLLGVRARAADGSVVLVFKPRLIEDFERRHVDRLRGAGDFTRLDEAARLRVDRLAERLARTPGVTASTAAARIAPRIGRGRETIRRRLLARKAKAGDHAFADAGALSARQRLTIWRAHRWGIPVTRIAERFGRSRAAVHRVINERRAELLRRLDLAGPVSPDFLIESRAEALLRQPTVSEGLGVPGEGTVSQFAAAWRDARAMSAQRERLLAEAYCLLKFRASAVVASLPRTSPGSRRIDEAETLLRWAALVKVELARVQAGLILRSVEERIGPVEASAPAAAHWIDVAWHAVSHAIDHFDPFRGGRLAAAASLALARALVAAERDHPRSPAQARRAARTDLVMADWTRAMADWNAWLAPHEGLRAAAARLAPPLGDAVAARFGFSGTRPMTMAELHARFGLTEAQIARAVNRASRLARADFSLKR